MSKQSISIFRKTVYKLAQEMKIPIVDERAIEKLSLNKGAIDLEVHIRFREGEEMKLKTFLAVAKYHHCIVIYKDEEFFIFQNGALWRLYTK